MYIVYYTYFQQVIKKKFEILIINYIRNLIRINLQLN